ncbi:MAG: hypothetical protein EOO24_27610 [Comamonadaceae bacterium]|nr:MAG: hypothetical protein EOO24_27610 [Comamonadaceae bacterium]
MTRRLRLVLLLLPALVLAQWLGLVHGIKHVRLAVPAAVAAAAAPQAASASGLDGLFSGHEGVTCRLLDQLGHADALPCVPLQLAPAVLPVFLAPVVTSRLLVALATGFRARAPPLLH